MLTLWESGFTSTSHEELINRIRTRVEDGKTCYLIVPEQQTVSAESEMCRLLPPSAPMCFEVTNFTRFANTVFRTLGGIGGRYCSPAESALIMWQTLSELSPMLSITGRSGKVNSGVVSRALTAVKEMQSLGITPEELAGVVNSEALSDARLMTKVNDLSLIYSLYKRILNTEYSDSTDDTIALAEKLRDNPAFLSDCEIYIEGFISFTEPQYRVLFEMIGQASVYVLLNLPKAERDEFTYTEVKGTHDRLTRLAAKKNAAVNIYRPDTPNQKYSPVIREMSRLLWRASGTLDNNCLHSLKENGGRVRIFTAETPFEECDFIAEDILRRVMEGEKFSDFAIIARHTDSYVGILDTSLIRAGVPHFISKRRDLSTFEAIKLINTAYAVADRGFRREDVLTYAKCGLVGVDRDELDEFELYVTKWQIDSHRFTDGEEWNMNPSGYRNMRETDALRLKRINETREAIISPLLKFKEESDEARTTREQAVALINFLTDIGLERSLYFRSRELMALGEKEAAEENARLWETVCSSLDTLVDVLGELKSDRESFIGQLSVIFSEASIGRIPSSADEVTVGQADMLRLSDKKHVYLIGVNEGEFPSTVTDSSYFTDRDKARLLLGGLSISPDLTEKSARELYCFTRAFTFASESVTLTHSTASASLSPMKPSEVIERIIQLSDGLLTDTPIKSLPLIDRIFSPEAALMLSGEADEWEYSEIKESLARLGMTEVLSVAEGSLTNSGNISKDTVALIYGNNMYLSQSKLDSFKRCPFMYYCKDILRLGEEEDTELRANVIGTFIHSVLENFFRAVRDRGINTSKMTPDEKATLATESSEQYISGVLGGGFRDARRAWAIERLSRAAMPVIDSLCLEFADSRFTPTFFELRTAGSSDAPGPIVYLARDGGKITISGIVDRVDTYKSEGDVYVRVVDYKSGAKVFSPDDLKAGENLQMFLYLKSITDSDNPKFLESLGVTDGGAVIPAGVLYVKTSVKDVTVNTPSDEEARGRVMEVLSERDGMILDDTESISAMNPSYLPKGVLDGESDRKYSREGWDSLTKDIEEVILNITDEMKSGAFHPTPKMTGSGPACAYCSFKPFCRSPRAKK